MKKNKSKPNEMTILEASDFWDEHDLSEFSDFKEIKPFEVEFSKKKYVALDEKLYKQIEKTAKKLKKGTDELIQQCLKQKFSAAH